LKASAVTIKYAEQKIHEARQRLASIDREMAALQRQSRKVAEGPDTRVALMSMREQSTRLGQERGRAYMELLELIELAEMPPEYMGWA
jgi:hypothetical protein